MKPSKKAQDMSVEELAQYIDHSVLKPEFSKEEVIALCKEGVAFGSKTECVQGCWIDVAMEITKGTKTGVAPCVGFPQGVSSTAVKVFEANEYCAKGVDEIDMVANFGWIRSGMYQEVEDEIRQVAEVTHRYNVPLKVILETDTLTPEQIVAGAKCVVAAGADFVKTSTGFITGIPTQGASVEVIELLRNTVGDDFKIKGSAAIRTREHFLTLIDMGIDRMGIGYKSMNEVLGLDENAVKSTDAY